MKNRPQFTNQQPIDIRLMARMMSAASEDVVESKKVLEDLTMRKKDFGRRAESKHQDSL